jgi:predicted ATPase
LEFKRVIISGGPGFGKTSIIEELEQRNFKCMHEVSRSIIREQIEKNGDVLPWKNLTTFSRILFERRVKQFLQTDKESLVFFDRGIPDIIAYMSYDNLEIPSSYMHKVEECSYFNKVFIVPPWQEIFKNDHERKEDFNTAVQLNEIIVQTYDNLGYEIITLPKVSVKERAEFILKKIVENSN